MVDNIGKEGNMREIMNYIRDRDIRKSKKNELNMGKGSQMEM